MTNPENDKQSYPARREYSNIGFNWQDAEDLLARSRAKAANGDISQSRQSRT